MLTLAALFLWLAESAIPAVADYARTGGLSLYLDAPPKPTGKPWWPMSPLSELPDRSK